MPELHLLSPAGFKASAVYAGIKRRQRPDVGLLLCDTTATAAAVFTTNKVFAAPIQVGREHIASGKLRGIVVNSGNANACTGRQGLVDARRMCDLAADVAGCDAGQILPSSTGIIGRVLPMQKIERGIIEAGQYLGKSSEHAQLFADAILTTDTCRKSAAVRFKAGRQTLTLAGVCKGSGMIGPRMGPPHATMLAYLTTDAAIAPALLRKMLAGAADNSFNAVTIDDHTSTNDTAAILASGASGVKITTERDRKTFVSALNEVCRSLAYQIAADGEGATKVVRVEVKNAATEPAARAIARAIADSPLVKCAMHGNDPNWGRIVSAAGMAGVPFDPDRCILTLQNVVVFRAGRPVEFDAADLSADLKSPEVCVELNCRMGKASQTFWTCDLSREYITINADYHT
ncbi:MAG: bifunctional glutamate N-acetyltransferase/amino-acid acetyltransferase ArgJ [Phycisphaerales bacterium]|nr:bifunctional glutamate N-acetyltransferase/amino-acid acetyltransferase ArgJ [Phycisphaerales bacterium]